MKLSLRSGSQRHRHFVGSFNVPVQAPTRDHPFYSYSEKPPHLVSFYYTLGIRRTYSHLRPRGPDGERGVSMGLKKNLNVRSSSHRHRHFVGFFNVTIPKEVEPTVGLPTPVGFFNVPVPMLHINRGR